MDVPAGEAIQGKIPSVPPTAPDKAAATFRVQDGFHMDLIAAEPLVASPVAMAYDENGRAYVCEMRDYPYTDKAQHKPNQENPTDKPIGQIRLLIDEDGDGVFDRATVFADGLSWPTGVACWKGGVFVAATPDLWYFKDNDGDGVADVREKLFTGFRKLNVQAVMNNLVWGLDSHLHGAGGSNGGKILSEEHPQDSPLLMARADFRIDPVTHQFELESGGARFGGSYDDWGNRFLCNIRNPAQHIVLPSRYLARNRTLAVTSAIHDMAESGDQLPVYPISPPEPWRVIRAERWSGERDIVMPRSELVGAGVVTSSSGVTAYRGDAYPDTFRHMVFVAECAGNLFYRLRLEEEGVTFRATRVDQGVEMVASTDNWFRPVNFCNAPDGTLHIMDMYRENIEHPWSIPEDIHAAVDLEAGRDMGRIWRLTPPNFQPRKSPHLGDSSDAELVATLKHPSSWWRETAQRLLVERGNQDSIPLLRDLVRKSTSPVARLHALWILHRFHALDDETLLLGLHDSTAGVRENSVRLAEAHLDQEKILSAVLSLAADDSMRVRFQTAFTLGESSNPRTLDALAEIARRDATDPWMRDAILSSVADTGAGLLARLIAKSDFSGRAESADLLIALARQIGLRGKADEIESSLSAAGKGPRGGLDRVLSGIGEGLMRSGKSLRSRSGSDTSAQLIDQFLSDAAKVATNRQAPAAERVTAISRLEFDDFSHVETPLSELLDPTEPSEVQIAAIQSISHRLNPEAIPLLLSRWEWQTPVVRNEVITAFTAVRSRLPALVDAIEKGRIPANQVPFAQRRLFFLHPDSEVKAFAEKHFAANSASSRQEVIDRYRTALSQKGDPAKGRLAFEAACIVCHKAGDLGSQTVGPNLANIRAWSPDQILINILDPNREVTPNFLAYSIEMRDGRAVYGIIAEEQDASLTIVRPDGGSEKLLRSEISKINGTGLSLMPEGLEAAITTESMADLIAFLKKG